MRARPVLLLTVVALLASGCGAATSARSALSTSTTKGSKPVQRTTTSATPATPGHLPLLLHLSTGLYQGTVDAVDPADSTMTYTVTSSCGTPNSGTWNIGYRGATFDMNTQPNTEMGQEVTISQQQWIGQVQNWKSWHILVPPSGVLDISDGPEGGCHGSYSFLP